MGRHTHTLYTIGYAGHTLETFIAALQAHDVSVLLDIRRTAISRKKGFSKSALSHALAQAGIHYQHIRLLGSPPDLRHTLHATRDFEAFFTRYKAYLEQQSSSIDEAAQLVTVQRVCLMCVEHLPHECHRSVVADTIADTVGHGVRVQHLAMPAVVTPQTPQTPQTRQRATIG